MLRIKQVDDYMEARFGKPDFSKTFFHAESGIYRTPMGDGSTKIWRVDIEPPQPRLRRR